MKYAAIREEASVEGSNPFMDFVVNPQLKSLNLHESDSLRDTHIIMLASIFPNLELLDLSSCDHISEDGILQVLRRCCKIRHLNLAHCSRVKLCGINSLEIPKLEVLNLSHTSVDDETLYVISMSCYGILQLLLESCDNVTNKGVEHVVKNCTQPREINLDGCFKVRTNVVGLMVFSRPSLRKITVPTHFCLSDRNTKHFLRHGCLVRKRSYI
jgi:F-box/leucine-rich repeat protein 2/20